MAERKTGPSVTASDLQSENPGGVRLPPQECGVIVNGVQWKETATEIAPQLNEQGRRIRLSEDRAIIFVGDTHGDLEATRRVFARYLSSDCTIVFLGDAVDRGPDSAANLDLILRTKIDHPDSVFLLMGNHEAWAVAAFSPADFWQGLHPQAARTLADLLSRLPFAADHPAGVLGLHGALPNLPAINAFESVELGSEAWRAITWGDWTADPTRTASSGMLGRPTFGPAAFERRAARLGVRVLVRSHQPFAPTYLYDDRCLTVFTSSAYGTGPRQVAVLKPGRRVRSARDLDLETID